MKGHKAHHHAHGGKAHHYGAAVHHKHPRAAHKKGGAVESPMEGDWAHDEAPHEVYAGAGSHVVHEAEEHKRGGRAKKHKHHVGKAEGHKAHHRADRKPRKSGGRASDMNPLSSAHKLHEPASHHSYDAEKGGK
jgi:hypothetical protein